MLQVLNLYMVTNDESCLMILSGTYYVTLNFVSYIELLNVIYT